MIYKIPLSIQAKSETEAAEIARAMEKMSGHFTAKEWAAIARKLESKINQQRIKLFVS
jgi:hypothetical protein